MKICAAQIRSLPGDIEENIHRHELCIEEAAAAGAALVFFPELSLSAYVPSQAGLWAMDIADERFQSFQQLADRRQISIALSAPLRTEGKPCIALLIFQPGKALLVYRKRYLYVDEEAFFSPGTEDYCVLDMGLNVAFAICYESSLVQHVNDAAAQGAEVYLASVVRDAPSVERSSVFLPEMARQHGMLVMMANTLDQADEYFCVGSSAAWNREGTLLNQLSETDEGLLLLDTTSGETEVLKIPL